MLESFRAMTANSSEIICLYHHRRYTSIIQRILNLLRKNKIQHKCDLNYLGKQALCICKLTPEECNINENDLMKKQNEYEYLKKNQWIEEINRIIDYKILRTCSCKKSIYKLLKFFCDISSEKTLLRMIKRSKNSKKARLVRSTRPSLLISRRIELVIPANKIGQLIGRNGHVHKELMDETNTKIHFENLPYTIPNKDDQKTDFNLEVFLSSQPVKAVITGDTEQSINNAIKALEKLQTDIC